MRAASSHRGSSASARRRCPSASSRRPSSASVRASPTWQPTWLSSPASARAPPALGVDVLAGRVVGARELRVAGGDARLRLGGAHAATAAVGGAAGSPRRSRGSRARRRRTTPRRSCRRARIRCHSRRRRPAAARAPACRRRGTARSARARGSRRAASLQWRARTPPRHVRAASANGLRRSLRDRDWNIAPRASRPRWHVTVHTRGTGQRDRGAVAPAVRERKIEVAGADGAHSRHRPGS